MTQRKRKLIKPPERGPSPLMSMRETADYLRISVTALYVRYAGRFETVRIGKRVFITRESADKFIAERTKPARIAPEDREVA